MYVACRFVAIALMFRSTEFVKTKNRMPLLLAFRKRSLDHPDIAYLDRYAHACCSPFGAAEQRKGARRAGIVGCLYSCFGQAKEVCQAASKGTLMDN